MREVELGWRWRAPNLTRFQHGDGWATGEHMTLNTGTPGQEGHGGSMGRTQGHRDTGRTQGKKNTSHSQLTFTNVIVERPFDLREAPLDVSIACKIRHYGVTGLSSQAHPRGLLPRGTRLWLRPRPLGAYVPPYLPAIPQFSSLAITVRVFKVVCCHVFIVQHLEPARMAWD